MSRRLTILLFFTFWLVYLLHFNPTGSGSSRFTCLTRALVEHGTIDVTAYYRHEPIDIMPYKGRYYINTNPGLSFLAAPVWAVVYAGYRQLPARWMIRSSEIHFVLAHFVCYSVTTALLGALTAIMLGHLVMKRIGVVWRAIFAACLYAFGTTSFFLSTRLNQNVVITFLALGIYILVFEPAALGSTRDSTRAALLGLAVGMGVLVDLSIVPFLVVLLAPIAARLRGYRGFALFAVTALIPVSGLALYQWAAFGNPILPAQCYMTGFLGPSAPHLSALLDHLFLPSRGLFVYMPFTALCAWYLVRNWQTDRCSLAQPEKVVIAALYAVFLLYVSVVQSSVFSGYGPRYLLPILPYSCLILALYLRKQEQAVATVLIGSSLLVQMAGAQCGRDTANMFFEISLWVIRGPWLPMVDWLHGNTFVGAWMMRHGLQGTANSSGLLLMLCWCLLLLWTPYCLDRYRRKAEADGHLPRPPSLGG
jgi:hypothetical protein